ncbi:ThuA domain-containing protein [Lewinella sp. JB7]|uniref:ThuA domain-containing protein n=1 Tax=Lewinella sp. JB7 TaxID=2962887 RepID=UPI0020C976E6|nr:ThuA domain-containing protein [Lewinella sp. JB7]MCP9237001.1 ThuA domain-containing protein [Lewinella sp. JB7]
MQRRSITPLLCLLICSLVSGGLYAQQFRALLITETAGWHHPSITAGIPALQALAQRHEFVLDRQQDAIPLSDKGLEKYDVIIMLSTTGDIFTDEEQAAFERFIQSGKGYVGIHAASDTEYEWPWYTRLVGRMFKIHPTNQTAMLQVTDPAFPGLERWPRRMLWTDEWYEFQDATTDGLNTIVTVDESTYDPKVKWGDNEGKGMGETHPIAWYHDFDGGRAFYTALGHMDDTYKDDLFLQHIYGGIYWAATGKGLKATK